VFDSDPEAPDVVEFGEGGSGCPTASATTPEASVNGAPVAGGQVGIGAKVKFTSKLTQANALAVEWEFINKATKAAEKVSGPANEFEQTEITHAFTTEGEYTVKETITSDDLASPTLVVEAAITAKAAPPTPQFSVTEATLGSATRFDAGSSSGNGSPITQYSWDYGDNTTATSATATAEHTYSEARTYQVTLTVTNKVGSTKSAPVSVVVLAPAPPPPPPPPPPPTTTTTTTTTPPPGSGVQGYRVSVASTSLAVSKSGGVSLKVSCAGQGSCTGTVTLRTLSAVAASAKKRVLTLASGSFSVPAGGAKAVALHLSAKARALLARSHVLRVRATIVGRDASGGSHTSSFVVTLKAAKAKH
jgi:PKD repeat protein